MTVYEFASLYPGGTRQYIFQRVAGRPLTDIPHTHDFYEWIWFLDGEAVQNVNGRTEVCPKGSVLLLRPGDSHFFVSQSEELTVVSLSVCREEMARAAAFFEPSLLTQLAGEAEPRLFSGMPAMSEALVDDGAADTENEYSCRLLLSAMIRACLGNRIAWPGIPRALALALEAMGKPEHLRAGVDALCGLTHYSRSHLNRLFRRHLNTGPKAYVNELRLQKAYRELILTDRAPEAIAEDLGFASFSHFSRIFKARYMLTPAALRRRAVMRTT